MLNQNIVSIIVPAYNQEKYIGRCLRSLLSQSISRNDYKIIVIDDGSSDKTNYALELFKNEIILIKNKVNKGLPYSLNRAIKIAKSKYIVRVDSDDYVNEDFLKLLINFLEQNNYMNAVACDYLLVNDKEDIISRQNCTKNPIACGIMFRKDQLIDIGLYDESFLINEEKDLRIRFLKKYNIHRIELPLYRYRMHTNNMTKNSKRVRFHNDKLTKKHAKIKN